MLLAMTVNQLRHRHIQGAALQDYICACTEGQKNKEGWQER